MVAVEMKVLQVDLKLLHQVDCRLILRLEALEFLLF